MGGDLVFLVRDVSKRYGDRAILQDINFSVGKGEILGIIGASGAGKSTLLHMLVGFVPSSTGTILFHAYTPNGVIECNVLHSQKLVNTQYGFASQQPSFYDQLTVNENLFYFGRMYGLDKATISKNADVLLRLMELKASTHVLAAHLSGGMKRRLDIACALIHNPPVLIMDEPTADLDPVLRTQIWEVIKRINARGTTIVLSSHHLNELDTLCHRIGILKDGKIVDLDTPQKLKSKYSRTQEILIETFPGNYDGIITRLKSHNIKEVTREGTYLTIKTENPEHVISSVIGILDRMNESLLDLKLIKPSLDSVFLSVHKNTGANTVSHNDSFELGNAIDAKGLKGTKDFKDLKNTGGAGGAKGIAENVEKSSVSDVTLQTIIKQLKESSSKSPAIKPVDKEHSLALSAKRAGGKTITIAEGKSELSLQKHGMPQPHSKPQKESKGGSR